MNVEMAAPGPSIEQLCPYKKRREHTGREEGHVKTEGDWRDAAMGQEHPGFGHPPEARERQHGFFPEPPEGTSPARSLIADFWPQRTVRENPFLSF